MLLEKTGPSVKVFTAGDHFSGHEEPAKITDIVETLLKRSGYTKGYEWECRIDKLKHCSNSSRPIRIVAYKPYGVILRAKPSAHSTIDYQATLTIPQGSGLSAADVFTQLKANEKSASRFVRQRSQKVEMEPIAPSPMPSEVLINPVIIEEPQEEPQEFRPEFPNLRGILRDSNKLKYVLGKLKGIIDLDFCHNKIQWAETLKHECKWDKEKHPIGAVTRVFTELVKFEYLREVIDDRNRVVGYEFASKGLSFIDRPYVAPKPTEAKKDYNISGLLVGLRGKLQELADVANRVSANNLRKQELQKQIEAVDAENAGLVKVLNQNEESYELLSRLGEFVTPLPNLGVKHGSESFNIRE